jgi:lysophospholipase L1-like esterase
MLMGAEDLTMLPDNLHPDGDGYELMGNRFADKIISKFNLR